MQSFIGVLMNQRTAVRRILSTILGRSPSDDEVSEALDAAMGVGDGSGNGGGRFTVGGIRLNADELLPLIETTRTLGRLPLAELGETDISDLVRINDAGRLVHTTLAELGGRVRAENLRGERRATEIQHGVDISARSIREDTLRQILEQTRREAGRGQRTPPENEREAERQNATADQVASFVEGFSWTATVPGEHYSGLSNEELREILAGQHRDFFADTPDLRTMVRDRLSEVFARVPWDVERAEQVTARAIKERIVDRIESQGVDVELAPLNPSYKRWKTSHGYSGKIGIMTGSWFASVKNAEVRVTA